MNEEKVKLIIRHCQIINTLMDCVDIEMTYDLSATKFNDPRINNHVRRIKESVDQIKKALSYIVTVKDREFSNFEHSPQVHRIFRYFATMDTKQLSEIMDQYEEYDKVNPPIEIS
mgnify:FL=1